MILPPGTLLQQMYFRERLRALPPGEFVEVGAGQGIVSRTLLEEGWRGTAYDLNRAALEVAARVNRDAVAQARYSTRHRDWLDDETAPAADLIVSCMVLEHLDDVAEARYLERCRQLIRADGRGVLFVPGSPLHWGAEDVIAGHYRRYTFEALRGRLEEHGLRVRHMAGLTFPLSNMLFPLSEFLVRRAEGGRAALRMEERTRLSGNRDVAFKTTFPKAFGLVLNEVVLYPLHVLQKLFRRSSRSMVIYAEFAPAR